MDKMKGLAKGGWHPSGDRAIHRDSWKSDLKGMATGKKKDPYEEQRNHQSAPLSSLKDPDSFGPPPKTNSMGRTATGSSTAVGRVDTGPSRGWGGSAVETGYAAKKRQQEEEERRRAAELEAQQRKESGPWRVDGTGLRTDNLPKPPLRRDTPDQGSGSPSLPARQQTGIVASPVRTASPSLPPRAPPRQTTGPPPVLPPRQNEYPDEHTPAPPPPYQEATKDPAQINVGAVSRLGQAGVNVPGFGIGPNNNTITPGAAIKFGQAAVSTPEVRNVLSNNTASASHAPPQGQLSELQQRFARMNTGASEGPSSVRELAQAATQKKPPPPPPKKAALSANVNAGESGAGSAPPPPVPMGSKPRPS